MFHVKHQNKNKSNWPQQEIEELCKKLSSCGLVLDNGKRRQLLKYASKIAEWNRRINLISTKDIERIVDKHFAESLAVALLIDFPSGSRVLDMGSGAGFPGVPLKISRPDLKLVLLDSKRMRSLFLRDVVTDLALPDTKVLCKRGESLREQQDYQGAFDFVLARAVAKLKMLWEWSYPLLKKSGQLVALKGGELTNEISELADEFTKINIEVRELPPKFSPYSKRRKLIIVAKK